MTILINKKLNDKVYTIISEEDKKIYSVISDYELHDGDIIMVERGKFFDYRVVKKLKSKPNKFKKILYSLFLISLLLLLISKGSSATSICSDNGAVFDDDNMCNAICSTQCSSTTLLSSGSSGTCNKNQYQGFVYYNNKTYAVSKWKRFWTDFNNLVIIPDMQTNNLLKGIINYFNITEAWIGLYDPNYSTDYKSVNPDRFIWRDGKVRSFSNWASGMPDNWIFDEDIGVVPIYGEHWVEMYSDGTWNDEGYHKYFGGDYKPRDYAIVEWDGALNCVNADTSLVDTKHKQSRNNLSNIICNGNTPCYACTNNGIDFQKCDNATKRDNSPTYSCPINRIACDPTYIDVECPQRGSFNANTEKCEAQPRCPRGGSFNANTKKCETQPRCPQGGSFNANTKKCEAQPR